MACEAERQAVNTAEEAYKTASYWRGGVDRPTHQLLKNATEALDRCLASEEDDG